MDDREQREYLRERFGGTDGEPEREPVVERREPDPEPDDDEQVVEVVEDAPMSTDEAGVEQVEPETMDEFIERAIADAAQSHGVHERNRISMCVRCGTGIPNRGNKPYPDDHGVAWLKCPDGCEPPDDADWPATCVPIDRRMVGSVLDTSLLGPDDVLGPEPPDEPESPDEPAPDAPEPEPGHPRRRPPLRDDLPTGRRPR